MDPMAQEWAGTWCRGRPGVTAAVRQEAPKGPGGLSGSRPHSNIPGRNAHVWLDKHRTVDTAHHLKAWAGGGRRWHSPPARGVLPPAVVWHPTGVVRCRRHHLVRGCRVALERLPDARRNGHDGPVVSAMASPQTARQRPHLRPPAFPGVHDPARRPVQRFGRSRRCGTWSRPTAPAPLPRRPASRPARCWPVNPPEDQPVGFQSNIGQRAAAADRQCHQHRHGRCRWHAGCRRPHAEEPTLR